MLFLNDVAFIYIFDPWKIAQDWTAKEKAMEQKKVTNQNELQTKICFKSQR